MTPTVVRRSRSGLVLWSFDFGAVKVPMLFVHHQQDGCYGTPYDEVRDTAERHHFPLITVIGSRNVRGDDCEAFSYHGFAGREKEVVAAIMNWVKTRAVTPTIE